VGHFAETPVSKSASSISVDEVCLNSQMWLKVWCYVFGIMWLQARARTMLLFCQGGKRGKKVSTAAARKLGLATPTPSTKDRRSPTLSRKVKV
jgi:hypothetical protein